MAVAALRRSLILILCAATTVAGAEERHAAPREAMMRDLVVTTTAGGGWLALWLARRDLARTSCPCSPGDANAFDRPAVAFAWSPGATVADIAAGSALVGALAGAWLAAPDDRAGAGDALLVAESIALSGLATQGVKAIASRPYPYMLRPAPFPEQNGDGINYESFWSGHTAMPMAAAVTFAYLYQRRHPRSPWRWVAWTFGPALALSAGLLQVSASNHYPTDVLAGAAAGATFGYVTPWAHEW